MAKVLFSKFPREVRGETIQLSGKRIPTLSSVLGNTKEAIKCLLIKRGSSSDIANNPERGVL